MDKTSNVENPHPYTHHQHSPYLRFYASICTRRRALWRAWGWPLGRAWWSLWWPQRASWRSYWRQAWTDYNGHNGEGSLHESESLSPLLIRFQRIAPDLTRSSGRRIRLSGIPAKLARDSQCRKRVVLRSKPAACRYLLAFDLIEY
jgi:hypothetical protein